MALRQMGLYFYYSYKVQRVSDGLRYVCVCVCVFSGLGVCVYACYCIVCVSIVSCSKPLQYKAIKRNMKGN